MTSRLPSYLRTHRLKSGLSQRELAFLLGVQSGAKVSRYERLVRTPNLHDAFACQALFGVAAHEIFPAAFHAVEEALVPPARILVAQLSQEVPTAEVEQKLGLLLALIEQGDDAPTLL